MVSVELTSKEKAKLRSFARALERLKQIDDRMAIAAILALVTVGVKNSPVIQASVEHDLGLPSSTASRSVAYWRKHRARDKPGMDMIHSERVPDDGWYRELTLKPKGVAFLRSLLEDLDG